MTAFPWVLAAGLTAFPPRPGVPDSVPRPAVAVSGFVDFYYAFDFGRPAPRERAFTTQAVRHNEANVNLAAISVAVERERVRGRITLQAGTSVQSNYAGEPGDGTTSGAALSRHIQEAYGGLRLAPSLWLDAGISLGSLGWEGWVSRDNPTYTRSLVAEYSPYYESGIRIIWEPAQGLVLQWHLMNGWQKISEDNEAKSASMRVDVPLGSGVAVAAAGFLGNEQPRGAPRATRLFGQTMIKALPHPNLLVQAQLDVGREAGPGGARRWWGTVGIARFGFARRHALVARLERFSDPDQVVASTGTPAGLVVSGGSIGLDVTGPEGLLWRTELRGLRGSEPLFPDAGGPATQRHNVVLITAFALTLH